MLQATQKKVIQRANMTLINIRTAEVSYFTIFFGNFGLQASIVTGAICGSISQTPALHGYDCSYPFVFLYFTTAATSVAISIYAILSALFLIVFGNGLALRGPIGSMAQTIDGMIFEQHSIVFAFVFSMLFFEISMGGMYMVMMDNVWGPISFTIAVGGIILTYRHCLRIFNRFRFVNPLSRWADHDDDPMKHFEEDNPEEKLSSNSQRSHASGFSFNSSNNNSNTGGHAKLVRSVMGDNNEETFSVNEEDSGKKYKKYKKSFLSRFLSAAGKHDFAWQYPHSTASPKDTNYVDQEASETPYFEMTDKHSGAPPQSLYQQYSMHQSSSMEGYLTVKSHKIIMLRDPWSRKYVVLKGKQIFIYNNRTAFTDHPDQPLNLRPIHLDGYSLMAGSSSPPYAISLVPSDAEDIREAWNFRCDTIAEYESWVERFTNALHLCAGDNMVVLKGTRSVHGSGDDRTYDGGSVTGSAFR